MAERALRRGRCIFPLKELFTALATFNPALPPLHPLLTAPPARSHVFLNLNSIWLTVINHAAGSREVYQTAAEARGEHNSVRDSHLFTAGCESTVLFSDSLRRQFVSKSFFFFRTIYPFWSGSDIICDLFFQTGKKILQFTPNLRRNTLGAQRWKESKVNKTQRAEATFLLCVGEKQL